jgi:hypothetical protein
VAAVASAYQDRSWFTMNVRPVDSSRLIGDNERCRRDGCAQSAVQSLAGTSWKLLGLLLLTLLLGLIVPAYADPSLITLPTGNQQPADQDRQAAPVEQPVLLVYRYDGPSCQVLILVVCRTSTSCAGTNWYAYCGGDPVNRDDPSACGQIIYFH